MILTFYIQGRPEGAAPLPSEIGYYEAFSRWIREKMVHVPELSLDEAMRWTKDQAECVWERSKQTFKYLSGAPVVPPPLPSAAEQENKAEKPEESKGWNVAGMFSSLKGSKGSSGSLARADHRAFTEGEVHADLVRVSTNFIMGSFFHVLRTS
jgi:import inner membrane translocase subunit TIM21